MDVILRIFVFSLLSLLTACSGSSSGSESDSNNSEDCAITGQNQFVLDAMNDIYLYYDQLPRLWMNKKRDKTMKWKKWLENWDMTSLNVVE